MACRLRVPALATGLVCMLLALPSSARKNLLPKARYLGSLEKATRALGGGIVRLRSDLPTVVIPDLHARAGYLARVLDRHDPETGRSYRELLRRGEAQVVLLGDAMHGASERAASRWQKAERDPLGSAMRAEAAESLGLMKTIMDLKAAYPDRFHYLKGNHDNILDENRRGNAPVSKHAAAGEGALTRGFLEHRFGNTFLARFHDFESRLPLVAVGDGFALSHSGPGAVLPRGAIQRRQARAVESFTWTDLTREADKQAAVARGQLVELGVPGGVFLVGHRQAPRVRKQGPLFQLNSEAHEYFAVIRPGSRFDPRRDLHDARPAR